MSTWLSFFINLHHYTGITAAFGKSSAFTDTSMKMSLLSVNGLPEKWRLRTKWSKMAVMRTACQKIRFQSTAFYNNFFFLVVCRQYHNFHLFKCFLREIAKTAANAATSHNVMIPTCAAVLKTCPPALTVMPTYS